jgi:hypothetical protein
VGGRGPAAPPPPPAGGPGWSPPRPTALDRGRHGAQVDTGPREGHEQLR